jgi:deazaflavin-dependent oxidoreductase (nitroreductase family)
MSEFSWTEFNKKVMDEFHANQGKVVEMVGGMPVVLITMTGHKTGRTITLPLTYSLDGDRMVLIASNEGAPKHPAWYHNLKATPEVTVEVGTEKYQAEVEETSGPERQRLFDQQAKEQPDFDDYQKKTTRQIPVLTLTRIE